MLDLGQAAGRNINLARIGTAEQQTQRRQEDHSYQ